MPPGKGPVEIIGQFEEMSEVARLFGWRSPTSWRVTIFSIIDHARGKTPNVLLTRNESEHLCRMAAATAINAIEDEFLKPRSPEHTEIHTIDTNSTSRVIDTILSYAHTSPPRHEPL